MSEEKFCWIYLNHVKLRNPVFIHRHGQRYPVLLNKHACVLFGACASAKRKKNKKILKMAQDPEECNPRASS
jgi:hypothetical protein